MDAAIVTLECQTIAEIVAKSITTEDSDIDDNEEHESHNSEEFAVESADLNFGEAFAVLDYLCRYVSHTKAMLKTLEINNLAFQIIEKCGAYQQAKGAAVNHLQIF